MSFTTRKPSIAACSTHYCGTSKEARDKVSSARTVSDFTCLPNNTQDNTPLGRISKLIDSGESANAELCRVYKRLDEIFPPFWLVARAPLFSRKSAPKFVPGGVLPCVLPGYKYTETPGRITHSTSHHSSYRSGGCLLYTSPSPRD